MLVLMYSILHVVIDLGNDPNMMYYKYVILCTGSPQPAEIKCAEIQGLSHLCPQAVEELTT